MSHCPQCKKLMRGVCRFCQPQEYINVVQQAFMDFADEIKQRTWVGLSDEDKQEWVDAMPWPPEPRHIMILIDGIEFELKEKNT